MADLQADPDGAAWRELGRHPSLEMFTTHIGDSFLVESIREADEDIELELLQAKALSSQPGTPREQPFALLFRTSADTPLGQGTVRLSHPDIGPLELFIVPVISGEEEACFEAVFN